MKKFISKWGSFIFGVTFDIALAIFCVWVGYWAGYKIGHDEGANSILLTDSYYYVLPRTPGEPTIFNHVEKEEN